MFVGNWYFEFSWLLNQGMLIVLLPFKIIVYSVIKQNYIFKTLTTVINLY